MTFEADALVKVSAVIYIFAISYQLLRRRLVWKHYLFFTLGFITTVYLITVLFFPFDIELNNLSIYQDSKPFKHTLIPFQYWIRDIFVNQTIDRVNRIYYSGTMTAGEIQSYKEGYALELLQMVWFSTLNLLSVILMTYSRLMKDKDKYSTRKIIWSALSLICVLDVFYIIRYFYFSTATDAFDSSFVFFQLSGLYLGYMFFQLSNHLSSQHRMEKRIQS